MDKPQDIAKKIVQSIIDKHTLCMGEPLERTPLMQAIDDGRLQYLEQCPQAGQNQYYNRAVVNMILKPRQKNR